MTKVLDVGLTGGIACGKSLVLSIFKAVGCLTLDADAVYHDLIKSGKPLYDKLVKQFGKTILDADGEIDRRSLGKIVFGDSQMREKLNNIAHPDVVNEQERIKKEFRKKLKKQNIDEAVIITDAALMIEAGTYKRYDKLVVVTCSPEIQIRRLMERSNIDEEEAQRRIASQMPLEEKAALADYVIENNAGPEQLIRRVEEIHHLLLEDVHSK